MVELQAQGESVDLHESQFLREEYGFDKPIWEQYLRWAGGMLHGDFGYSFEYDRPVSDLIGDARAADDHRVVRHDHLHMVLAFPIGIYSATHQYSAGATTASPSSAFSASPCRTSCSRW